MKKDCLTTFSKVDFNTFEPEEDKIRIEDIAHALSMMTRANGHFPQRETICHRRHLPVCFTMEVKLIWRTLPARSRKT